MDYQLISEAIVRFVHSTFARSEEQEIIDTYGIEVAGDVRAVYDRAMNCSVDWGSPGMDMNTALCVLADFMASELPQLSPEAKTRLNYCYIMCWK